MSPLSDLEDEKKQYQEQLDIVHGQLRDDPENVELKALQEELNNFIDLLNENIAELKPKQAPKPAPKQPSPPPEPEKWSRENHPAFKKATPAEEKEDTPVHYQVNDTVLAKWVTGDKAFYPARITSITGSSTDPIYIVKFKTYDNTETLRSRDIRPVSNKRKADGTPLSSTPATPPAPGLVTSAGATVYPEAKREAENNGDVKPPKAKKLKAKKELEKNKNKWQEFSAKSKFGKAHKKESMFRTPEGVNGRVGFTGSGQTMRKDPTRSRHVYQMNDELD
ncbi:Tudor domain-containing protein [Fusarium keratoplasticum]|uniref:Tudor domain-containing protein n=1 Tax=Fusarium keratoplasticum TaxID=1328300 RepID=A0ACC0R3L7_9HYPO|nr:Tudor domain-containing protein [Fusarium keratoplasticum]KAI8674828.1 Tudor domain-containing protein [Fusarium keratoplasticum]